MTGRWWWFLWVHCQICLPYSNRYIQIFSVTVMICVFFETKYGIGHHQSTISIPDFETLLHWQFYHSIVIMAGVSLVKISVGLFLLRFVNSKAYKRFVIGMISTFNTFPFPDYMLMLISLPRALHHCLCRHSHLRMHTCGSIVELCTQGHRKLL